MNKDHPFMVERRALLEKAKEQVDNFDYDVVVARRCDVKSRSKEENEKYAKLIINNQIKNITEYLEEPNWMKRNGN